MKRKQYLIPSLILAGFAVEGRAAATAIALPAGAEHVDEDAAVKLMQHDDRVQLAGHSSHRSHSSHSSHSSHRSSSGGGYYSPPVYSPPPRTTPALPEPRTYTPRANSLMSSPAANPFVGVVRRVQEGLRAYGYYTGAVDGELGQGTRDALRKMQADYKLTVTGTITPEVLQAFNIVPDASAP